MSPLMRHPHLLRVSRYAKSAIRFLVTIGAVVNFALAGTRWADDNDMSVRLIAWGLFNLSIIFLFLDRDAPPYGDHDELEPLPLLTDEQEGPLE